VADAPLDDGPPVRRGLRRLSGIDRSGGPPPETLRGQPLRPWTIPNAIGFARIGLLVAFVAVGFGDDESDALLAVLYALAAWGDQLDGLAARLTGQYSRLGALLDPAIDRVLVISGVIVTWHLDLLPRWALALLVAREALMLVLGPLQLRRGGDIEISMLGRWAVWPTMAAIFFALCGIGVLADVLLYVGLVMTLVATVRYARKLSTSA
jgi:phosphatidylglycerophosphate synthase